MTLKDMMLGTAVAALIAGGAVAQDTNTDATAPMPQAEGTADVEAQTEMGTDGTSMESGSDMTTEAPAESVGDAPLTPEEPMAPSADTETAAEEPAAPDAGEAMAPESDTAEAPASIQEMTVDQVIGQTVIGIDDETVGDIDYVVDTPSGLAFVVGVGGFLGLGEYTVAIPADQFSIDEEGTFKLTSMTKADIEAQPEFTEEGVESLPGDMVIGDLL